MMKRIAVRVFPGTALDGPTIIDHPVRKNEDGSRTQHGTPQPNLSTWHTLDPRKGRSPEDRAIRPAMLWRGGQEYYTAETSGITAPAIKGSGSPLVKRNWRSHLADSRSRAA